MKTKDDILLDNLNHALADLEDAGYKIRLNGKTKKVEISIYHIVIQQKLPYPGMSEKIFDNVYLRKT